MATIKSFTSLEQSRKLAKILPLESADMYWIHVGDGGDRDFWKVETIQLSWRPYKGIKDNYIPAWSLASLLCVLPNNEHITTTLSRGGWKIEPVEYIDKWFCEYEDEVDEDSPCRGFTVSADNPVDACVDMIIKLNEQKML